MVGIIRKRIRASQVVNDSTAPGANVDDALDALLGDIPTTEEIQDLVGAMVTGNTETGITVTYQDADGTIDFVVDSEWVQDLVGAMVSGNTETNITVTYQDADGTIDFAVPAATDSVAGVIEVASQAEQEAGTLTTHAVTPGRQQHHRSAAKAWVLFDVAGGLHGSYNVASVTDNGTGNWTVNIATDFSSTDYAAVVTGGYVVGVSAVTYNVGAAPTAGTYNIVAFNSSNASADPTNYGPSFVAFGDQ